MPQNETKPFESIESALEFMILLESVTADVSLDLRRKVDEASSDQYRKGLYVALFKLQQLQMHVQKSRRILNDLTLVRRVLTGESRAGEDAEQDPAELTMSAFSS